MDATPQLRAELDRYAEPAQDLVTAIRSALCIPGTDLPPVSAYIFRPSDEVFRAFFITENSFIMFEMLPSTEYITIAVPKSRLTRVVEVFSGGSLQVLFEIDADITRTSLIAEIATKTALTPDSPAGQVVSAQSETRRSGYEFTVDASNEEDLALVRNFIACARAAIGP